MRTGNIGAMTKRPSKLVVSIIYRCSLILVLGTLLTSCHVGRYFVYNFANIHDYKKFQNEEIERSTDPFLFNDALSKVNIEVPSFGIDSEARLKAFNSEHKTVAFLIIKDDSIYHEWYANKYDSSTVLTSFSMAKSYVAALIGIAIEEGHIKSVHDPITDYIKTFKHDGFEKITIEHVLNMRTGIDYTENYYSPFGNVAIGYYGRDLERHLSKLKIKEEPDQRFDYISIATQILGAVIQEATGESLTEYCEEKIWKKIGTEYGASWSLDRKGGMEKAFCCLNARARDYAKFGRLFLNNGNWEGEQVVPQSWVESSIKKTEESKDSFYGYQWWHAREYDRFGKQKRDVDFYMQGHLGQYVYMEPEKNIIVVRLGKDRDGVYWNGLLKELVDHIE